MRASTFRTQSGPIFYFPRQQSDVLQMRPSIRWPTDPYELFSSASTPERFQVHGAGMDPGGLEAQAIRQRTARSSRPRTSAFGLAGAQQASSALPAVPRAGPAVFTMQYANRSAAHPKRIAALACVILPSESNRRSCSDRTSNPRAVDPDPKHMR